MGLDASQVAGSVAKSLEVERSPGVTQRASEISQEKLATESDAALHARKPDAADQLQREKIRRERERRRRELERRATQTALPDIEEFGEGLDVVA